MMVKTRSVYVLLLLFLENIQNTNCSCFSGFLLMRAMVYLSIFALYWNRCSVCHLCQPCAIPTNKVLFWFTGFKSLQRVKK